MATVGSVSTGEAVTRGRPAVAQPDIQADRVVDRRTRLKGSAHEDSCARGLGVMRARRMGRTETRWSGHDVVTVAGRYAGRLDCVRSCGPKQGEANGADR